MSQNRREHIRKSSPVESPARIEPPDVTELRYLTRELSADTRANKIGTVNKYIKLVTEKNYNVHTLLLAMSVGYALADSISYNEQEAGVTLLTGVDSYLRNAGVCVKSLDDMNPKWYVDTNTKVKNSHEEFKKRLEKKTRTPRKFAGLESFMTVTDLNMAEITERNAVVSYLIYSFQDQNDVSREDYTDSLAAQANIMMVYEHMHRQIAHTEEGATKSNDNLMLRVPEIMLEQIKEASAHMQPTFHNLYEYEVEGVSVRSLEHETDMGEFGYKVLQYINGVPKGNLLWSYMTEGLFLTSSIGGFSSIDRSFFSNPEFSEKIYLFQEWLVEKLLTRVFNDEVDQRFESLFNSWITGAPEDSLRFIASLIPQVLTSGSEMRQIFDPSLSIGEALAQSPLHSLMIGESPNVLVGASAQNFLQDNSEKIRTSLMSRFSSKYAVAVITQSLDRLIGRLNFASGYQLKITELVADRMQNLIDIRTQGYKKMSDEEREERFDDVWSQLEEVQFGARGPSETLPMMFDKNSLLAQAGFVGIYNTLGSKDGLIMVIKTEDISLDVAIHIDFSSRKIVVGAGFDTLFLGLGDEVRLELLGAASRLYPQDPEVTKTRKSQSGVRSETKRRERKPAQPDPSKIADEALRELLNMSKSDK